MSSLKTDPQTPQHQHCKAAKSRLWDATDFEGKANTPPHDALYWRFGTQWAVRRGDWKLVQAREGRGGSIQIAKAGPVRLFHLKEDIAEQNDFAASHPEKVAELRQLWNRWNQQLPEPAWKPSAAEE